MALPAAIPTGAFSNPAGQVKGATPPHRLIAGTDITWHATILWYLGAIALIALAEPAPNIATWIVVLLIVGLLLSRWDTYRAYLGI